MAIFRKIKELSEIKLAHDQLKVDCDVDKRNYDLRIANEQDQTKKFQGITSSLISIMLILQILVTASQEC